MQLRGLRLLRIGGIQIVVDYSWLIIFFLIAYVSGGLYFPQVQKDLTDAQHWAMGMACAALVFLSTLLHGLMELLVATKQGVRVTSMRIFFFGAIPAASDPQSGRHEFLIALAGPAASIALAFFFGFLNLFLSFSGAAAAAAVCAFVAIANLLLALFNMIPGFPLDGGRVLRAILWDRWNDMARATKVVSQIGNGFAVFLMLAGVLQFLLTQSLVSGLCLIFIGLFMKQSSVGSYQAIVLKQALTGVQVRQIMTERVVTIDWLSSLEQLVRDYIYRYQFSAFPVFNRDEFVGMVSLSQVKIVPKELWIFKQVRDIMTPLEQVASLKPTDDATDALARMVTDDLGRMPVVDNGRLVGIVSRRDIMNLFKIKSDLGVA